MLHVASLVCQPLIAVENQATFTTRQYVHTCDEFPL